MMNTGFLIAAPMSGSGKTTIARGLMALFVQKGYRVQPFKCGPDYIDTKFHAAVCGRPSVNLDTFMATPEHVRHLFDQYGRDADVCVVEGMMGLFDGYDRDRGSSAEIARVLGLPVVLVVDARSAAYSMAALLQGFLRFRDDLRFAGVIFNKVGSERHARMLREVCADLDVTCLGCLPKCAELEQGSRYLGLDFSHIPRSLTPGSLTPSPSLGGEGSIYLQAIADNILNSKIICIRETDEISVSKSIYSPLLERGAGGEASERGAGGEALIAHNSESFSFLYQETIDRFSRVRFFDPECEVPHFDGIDLLYLPGGYPEKHAEALVKNSACRQAIRDYAGRGGRIVAECGGMMYLCQNIVTDEGAYPMCGVLPYDITARKQDRRLSLGYRRFTLDGREYRGHEFHYTQFLGDVPPSAAQVYNAKGEPVPTPVLRYKNVLASYTHLYNA